MDSRKMVQMNLLAGQEQRCRHRECTCGHKWGKRGRDILREQHWHINTTAHKMYNQWEADV